MRYSWRRSQDRHIAPWMSALTDISCHMVDVTQRARRNAPTLRGCLTTGQICSMWDGGERQPTPHPGTTLPPSQNRPNKTTVKINANNFSKLFSKIFINIPLHTPNVQLLTFPYSEQAEIKHMRYRFFLQGCQREVIKKELHFVANLTVNYRYR